MQAMGPCNLVLRTRTEFRATRPLALVHCAWMQFTLLIANISDLWEYLLHKRCRSNSVRSTWALPAPRIVQRWRPAPLGTLECSVVGLRGTTPAAAAAAAAACRFGNHFPACPLPSPRFPPPTQWPCSLPFNFPHVGVTRAAPPLPPAVAAEGWSVDHSAVQVGRGQLAYRQAQGLLQQWRHFDLGWASVGMPPPPVRQGAGVVVTARTLLCWSCNPLRISWVAGEGPLPRGMLPPWAGKAERCADGTRSSPGIASSSRSSSSRSSGRRAEQQQQASAARGRRYAFAHATLEGHQIRGEERFAVAWNQEDDSGLKGEWGGSSFPDARASRTASPRP